MAKFQPDRAGRRRDDDGLREKMMASNRVTKVVKRAVGSCFAALTVVGDGDGGVGMGRQAKGRSPSQRPWKACRNMVKVSPANGTIHHQVTVSTVRPP